MLRLGVLCLAIALGAAIFGFGFFPDYSWEGTKTVSIIFLVLAVLLFLAGGFRKVLSSSSL